MNYYGVHLSWDGRWLSVSAHAGTAPRTDVWLADLSAAGPEQPAFAEVQGGVDAQHLASFVSRDGRALRLHRPRRARAAGWPSSTRPTRRTRTGSTWSARTRRRCSRTSRSSTARSWATPACCWSRLDPARGQRADRARPGHRRAARHRAAARPRHHRRSRRATRGRPRGVVRLHRLRHAEQRPALRRPRPARSTLWATGAGHGRGAAIYTPAGRVHVEGRHDRPDVAALRRPATPDRPRPTILYGYGGFGIPLGPGYSRRHPGLGRGRRRLRGRPAARRRRGGRGLAPGRHARPTSRTCSTTSTPRPSTWSRPGWTTPGQLGISGGSNGGLLVGAALTQRPDLYRAVVCSAPLLDMVRYELFGLGATWAEEYGTARDPEQLGWLLGYSPYHRVVDGTAYPAVLFTIFDGDTRVDTDARPQAGCRPAARHDGRPGDPSGARPAGEGRRALQPRAVPQHRALRRHLRRFLAAPRSACDVR